VGGCYLTLCDCESVGGFYLTLRDCESVGGCYLTLRDCESVGGCYLMPNELFFSYIMERISYIFILLFASVESIVL
jgi:hypothetical protein